MPSLPALFIDSSTVVTLYRLHTLLDGACRSACDVDLGTCAALGAVMAHPQGFDVRKAREAYGHSGENTAFEQDLKELELVKVVRSSRDRRALALQATPKGRERMVLAHRVLGACLVEEHPGLTEQSFDQLVKLSCDYATIGGFPPSSEGLFPAPVLRDLAAYVHRLELVAARFGMASAQIALLLDRCGGVTSGAGVATAGSGSQTHRENTLGLAPWVLDAEIGLLRDRGLLSAAGSKECTEAAVQRIAEFTQRLNMSLAPWWQASNTRLQAAAVKLLQYVLYLFS